MENLRNFIKPQRNTKTNIWHDEDTCNLIVDKLKGKSPIEYAVGNDR